jgi:hypothetical protein
MATWLVGAAVVRYGWAPAERCPTVTAAAATTAAVESAGWYARAQLPDGRFTYEYDRRTGVRSPDDNVIRQAGALLALYQLAADGHPDGLPTAERARTYAEANLLRRDGWAALAPAGQDAELGASAILAVALMQRALVTGDHADDELVQALGRFVLGQQRPDGSFLGTWSRGLQAPLPGYTSNYSTGEAFFALAMLANRFPDGGWRAPTLRASHYIATQRDEDEGYDIFPWGDQWSAYALDQMRAWPIDADAAAYARRLAERFGYRARRESQKRDDGIISVLRNGPTRGAGFGTTLEGLGSLWRLASADPRLADLRRQLAERVACAAGLLIERQASTAVAAGYAEPGLVAGAWYTNDVTRLDDQQHTLAGLAAAAAVLDQRDGPAG